jgi:hypothetical protein
MGRNSLEDSPWVGWWLAAAAVEGWRREHRWARSWVACASELASGRGGIRVTVSGRQLREWAARRRHCIENGIVPRCLQPENPPKPAVQHPVNDLS